MSKERVKVSMDYNLKSHIIGKIWLALSLVIFFAVPTTICLYYDVKPDMSVMGTSAVLIPFIINFFSGIFEPIIYSPMLGINSAYLAFITGNLSNLKIPCVVKAQEICGTKLGTEENEVVSTLSVATSTLVTTVIIAVFVLILAISNVETAIKNTPWITPAFTCVVYALFGSLGGKYVVKNIKLAVFPLVIIVAFSLILGFAAPKLGVIPVIRHKRLRAHTDEVRRPVQNLRRVVRTDVIRLLHAARRRVFGNQPSDICRPPSTACTKRTTRLPRFSCG